MSLYHNGESCAYCKAKLFSDDDVVYCPVCGAPHHRDCYNSIGHCALEALHGTENEYSKEKELEKQQKEEKWLNLEDEPTDNPELDKEKYYKPTPDTVRCKMCGEIYDAKRGSCPKCKAPNFVRYNGITFDFLGGVPAEEEIDDGITAEDAKKFVIANTQRYIPKFAQFKKGRKASWNWLAFLFPSCWMFSRKMYTGGIITGVLQVISYLLLLPYSIAEYNFTSSNGITDIFTETLKNPQISLDFLNEIGPTAMLLSFAGIGIGVALRVFCGIFGDLWYKKHTVAAIKKIRAESHDSEMDHRKKGGVNVFLFLISYLALDYLKIILVSLL